MAKGTQPGLKPALKLAIDLMKIDGPSKCEGAVVANVIRRLRAAGLAKSAIRQDKVHRKIGGEVGNLFVVLPGTLPGPRRLISAHIDSVPLCVGAKPVRRGRRIISGDRTRAIGADNRAGVAATLTALLTILKRKLPHPPVTFLWTVQEELGLLGAKNVSIAALSRPTMGFNFDGARNVAIGAIGAQRFDVIVEGSASHAGSAPEKGVSAITIASMAVADLQAKGWLGKVVRGRQYGTSNVGVVEAGSATNVVCPRALVKVEARSHSVAFRARIASAIEKAFIRAAGKVRNDAGKCGRVRFEQRGRYEPFRLARTSPPVAVAAAAVKAVGAKLDYLISDGGLDANEFTARGVPTVTFATGGVNPHTDKEYLDVRIFEGACRVALQLATQG